MLHLHASGRIEPLAAALAAVLSRAPSDPMAPEWIAVPSEGMRRWLNLELARHLGTSGPGARDGVAANIVSAFPGSLRGHVVDAAASGDAVEVADPWSVDRMVWPVLEMAAGQLDDPLLAPLFELPEGSSRFGRARRMADLFDRYHVHRPAMVRSWAAGEDVDATGSPLPEHHRWQPRLWRLIRTRIDVPSPAERLPELLDRLRSGELVVDLPDRVVLFGLSLLPGGSGFIELAHAVATDREVHLFLLEPSPAAAVHVTDDLAVLQTGVTRWRADDRTAASVRHPLVRSWGRLHRETTVLLADAANAGLVEPLDVAGARPRRAGPPSTVLEHLHDDIAADRAPVGDLELAGDHSISFHACHGTTRQVEVLRDVLLHLIADEALELDEDDILVVCPDLERFAPVIDAVLGPSSGDRSRLDEQGDRGVPALRYRIADRSIGSANPVLAAMTALLELVTGRFDAPRVLDFMSLGPVRERFGSTDDDLARLAEWVEVTHVRWGFDARHREGFGVPASITNNTWRAGLDRLLLGAAVTDDERALAVGEVAPHGVEGDDVHLLGRFADLLWRLGELAEAASSARPVHEWVALLRADADELFGSEADAEWQMETLHRLLGEIVTSAEGTEVPLDAIDVRRLLADRLADAPGRPDFFRGGITISSMTPLRWVPHRAVVLLGMDQAALGTGSVEGDDLAAVNPALGDRDRRGESRQSLLEAVLSARDRLVLIRDGHDVRTNHEVPPAVAVAELRDTLVAMVAPERRGDFLDQLEVAHPRQPFDERCFEPGRLVGDGPWSFDRTSLSGALARRDRSTTLEPFLPEPLEQDRAEVVELADLHAFLKDPVKHFLTRRLGVRLPGRDEGLSPLLPVGLGGLEQWDVGARLLRARLDGVGIDEWRRVELRLGTLPPAALGDALLESFVADVDALLAAAIERGLAPGTEQRLAVDARLPDGTRVIGRVQGLLGGDTQGPVRLSFSKDRPAFRLPSWLDLIGLAATDPEASQRAVGVYRNRTAGRPPVVVDLEIPGAAEQRSSTALDALAAVVDLYRRGSAEPLPIFEYLTPKLRAGNAGANDWSRPSEFGGGGDGDRPGPQMAFGGHDYESLVSIPVAPHDPLGRLGAQVGRAEHFAHVIWHAYETSVVDRADEPSGADG